MVFISSGGTVRNAADVLLRLTRACERNGRVCSSHFRTCELFTHMEKSEVLRESNILLQRSAASTNGWMAELVMA